MQKTIITCVVIYVAALVILQIVLPLLWGDPAIHH